MVPGRAGSAPDSPAFLAFTLEMDPRVQDLSCSQRSCLQCSKKINAPMSFYTSSLCSLTCQASLPIFEKRIFWDTSGPVFAVRWKEMLRYLRLQQRHDSHPVSINLSWIIKSFQGALSQSCKNKLQQHLHPSFPGAPRFRWLGDTSFKL